MDNAPAPLQAGQTTDLPTDLPKEFGFIAVRPLRPNAAPLLQQVISDLKNPLYGGPFPGVF